MTLFPALPVAESGAEAMQTWIDTSAGNIANMNDVAAVGTPTYAAETPVFAPVPGASTPTGPTPGDGVEVQRVALGTDEGEVTYQPTSPLADARGDVALPNLSLSDQMIGMIEAQESYSADAAVIAKAQTAYQAGLGIGS